MPDYTICSGEDCPRKSRCLRSNVKPDYLQSYFLKPPYENGRCEYFIELASKLEIKEKSKLTTRH